MDVTLTIDGRTITAQPGEMLLAVAKRHRIDIPALCSHEALEAWGGCRLCLVEITKPQWDGWSKLVISCLYPVEEGLIVETRSEKVMRVRRTILDLLLARAPQSEKIRELAREYGVYKTTYTPDVDRDKCIMCGMCVRICEEMGINAISTVQRGYRKEIATPFGELSEACIGCLACAHICPTGNIPFTDDGAVRTIWNRSFKLVACEECGRAFITEEQLEYEVRRSGLERSYFTTCDVCKRARTAGVFRELAEWQKDLEEVQ
ncbi:(2Fe-2S)-binding protein [bacterium]|nr:(2Fe-2S)-binding protein [candidate division CSSED10-310 bacterium]